MKNVLWVLATLGALTAPCAFASTGETILVSGTATQILHPDSGSLQFYLNSGVVAGATSSLSGLAVIPAGSNPIAAIETSMAQWNNAGLSLSANLNMPALQTTSLGHDPTDCKNVISIAGTAADLSALGFSSAANPGAVGLTVNVYLQGAGAVCGGTTSIAAGSIIDSDILLNPYFQFSTTGATGTKDLQGVITHEMGHVLGLNHSNLLSATMYPYATSSQRHLSTDEKAFIASFYSTGAASLGTINGTVTVAGVPVKYGLVTCTELSGSGAVFSTVTGADGAYSVQVTQGVYNVYAEPFNSFIGPTNIYSLASATGVLDPTAATTAFSATFSGGNSANPPTFTVSSGTAARADIAVTAGATSLAIPLYGIGKAGGNGDVHSFIPFNTSIPVTSGTDFDLVLSGAGIDSTIQVEYIGTNVTVDKAGPRVDTSGVVNGHPIIRQHISIGTQTAATMGSLWIVNGTTVLPLTGILDLEPSTPVISSAQDAESAGKTITSGQYFAVYGSNLANNTRGWNPVTDFTGGVAAGNPLPTNLDGVSVSVNGQPASIFYTAPGQINAIAPANLSPGPATVTVTNDLSTSGVYNGTTIASAAPSFFIYASGANFYPVAVHLNGDLVSDSEKAHPGETILMFANGLTSANGNVVATVAAVPTTGWSLTAGSNTLNILGAALVYAGEYQVNVSLPNPIATGNYTLTLSVQGGSTSGNGITVTLPVGP